MQLELTGTNPPIAGQVVDQLFPDGTGFTRLDAAGLWDRTDSLLARITELHLETALVAGINPRLLTNVRYAFERLSRAIQVSGDVLPTVPNALTEANARFSFALAKYARALSVRVSDDDDASFARFLSALAPIDARPLDSREPSQVSARDAYMVWGLLGSEPFDGERGRIRVFGAVGAGRCGGLRWSAAGRRCGRRWWRPDRLARGSGDHVSDDVCLLRHWVHHIGRRGRRVPLRRYRRAQQPRATHESHHCRSRRRRSCRCCFITPRPAGRPRRACWICSCSMG